MPSKESLDKAMFYLIDVYRFDGDNQATLADLLDEAIREARLECLMKLGELDNSRALFESWLN